MFIPNNLLSKYAIGTICLMHRVSQTTASLTLFYLWANTYGKTEGAGPFSLNPTVLVHLLMGSHAQVMYNILAFGDEREKGPNTFL